LNDGKVAIATRMTWDTGAQTVFDEVALIGTFGSAMPIVAGDNWAVAYLCPKTPFAIPVGTLVAMAVKGPSGAMTLTSGGQIVQFDDGSNGFLAVGVMPSLAPIGGSVTGFEFIIQNSNGSTTVFAPGATFDLGEVWFGTLDEFEMLTDPKLDLVDPTLNRRSHSNQPWPLFLKPYNQWTYNFAPMTDAKAYDSGTIPSFASVRYALSQATCALVLPRVYVRGSKTTVDAVALNQLTCFGKPDKVNALAMVKESGALWTASMVFGQAPP
jgi:hypothetical protein